MGSAYLKYNSRLASQSVEEVAKQICKTYNSPAGIPLEMLKRLRDDLQQAVMDYLSKTNPQAAVHVKNVKHNHKKRDEERKQHQQKINNERRCAVVREAIVNALSTRPWWEVLRADHTPSSWTISPTDTADFHVGRFLENTKTWWEHKRANNMPVEDVLEQLQKDFPWPARLPAAKTIMQLLEQPAHLNTPSVQTRSVVVSMLAELKRQRAEERNVEKLARDKRKAIVQETKQRLKDQQQKILDDFVATGRFPDGDRRSWRRLAEVAELIGLSASTVRADLKKNHLTASDTVRANAQYNTSTTVHSRADLRAYLLAHRPNVDVGLVEQPTALERVARNQMLAQQRWDDVSQSRVLVDGHRLQSPPEWPMRIPLQVASDARKARERHTNAPNGTLQTLQEEVKWLAQAWATVVKERAKTAQWSTKLLAAVMDFFNSTKEKPLLPYEVAWPNGFSEPIERARLERILSQGLAHVVRSNSKLLKGLPTGVSLHDPLTWYPKARALGRKWVLHIGPTNSGKTYQAMEAMQTACTGVYLAPLRLMALEGFERLVARGLRAQLLTGEERQCHIPEDKPALPGNGDSMEQALLNPASTHISATIEAGFNENQLFDVAVVDEAQMMDDRERGWAWAQALAGICAKELHVCAAPEARAILLELADKLGEEVTVVEHKRLTPLTALDAPVDLKELTKGDALVVFSRRQLMGYRSWLRSKGKSVAVIYGDLGPEVRRAEAERFRSGKADILVSTDAIGMGLNLPIGRVVFADTSKFDGISRRPLEPREWRQIAGRAGRHGLYDQGFYGRLQGVNGFSYSKDHVTLFWRFRPPISVVRALGVEMGWTKLSEIEEFWAAPANGIAPSSEWGDKGWINALSASGLSLEDQYRYLGAPGEKSTYDTLQYWVRLHASGKSVPLPQVECIQPTGDRKQLVSLEQAAATVRLYRWCSLSFPHVYGADASMLHVELASAISQSLATMELANLCDGCGRRLPVGHPHANCDECFQNRGRRYDDCHWL